MIHFLGRDGIPSTATRLDEQRVGIRERLNASLNGMLETIRRVGLRKVDDRLHSRHPTTRHTVALAIQMPPLGDSTFMTYEEPPRHCTFHCFAGC